MGDQGLKERGTRTFRQKLMTWETLSKGDHRPLYWETLKNTDGQARLMTLGDSELKGRETFINWQEG